MIGESSSYSSFKLTYEGETLNDHTIDVSDLIPALQGANELVLRSNAILNPDEANAILRIRPPEPGCFEIGFALGVIQATAMLGGINVITTAVNLQRIIVGGSAPGLLSVLKWLRGSGVQKVEDESNHARNSSDDSVVIEHDSVNVAGIFRSERQRMRIPSKVYTLLQDPEIRDPAAKLLSPLKRVGIDSLLIQSETDNPVIYRKEDLPSFDPLPQESGIVSESVSRQLLKVETPHLGPRNRQWRFHDGNKSNLYTMKDEKFLQEVKRGERVFAAGDLLDCEVRLEQTLSGDNLKTKLEVTEVFGHRTRGNYGTQLRF